MMVETWWNLLFWWSLELLMVVSGGGGKRCNERNIDKVPAMIFE
jgi:hypothetical protein